MPSLNLTPDQVPHVRCLPGTALIRCSPPPKTADGTGSGCSKGCVFSSGGGPQLCREPDCTYRTPLIVPDAAASWAQENQAIREGVIVTMNRCRRGSDWQYRSTKPKLPKAYAVGPSNSDEDSMSLDLGMTVLYLGRQDEANDDYVVVKIGQIVAVKETGK